MSNQNSPSKIHTSRIFALDLKTVVYKPASDVKLELQRKSIKMASKFVFTQLNKSLSLAARCIARSSLKKSAFHNITGTEGCSTPHSRDALRTKRRLSAV